MVNICGGSRFRPIETIGVQKGGRLSEHGRVAIIVIQNVRSCLQRNCRNTVRIPIVIIVIIIQSQRDRVCRMLRGVCLYKMISWIEGGLRRDEQRAAAGRLN